MSSSPNTPDVDLLADEFACLAEGWGELGMWCTLWNDRGQPGSAVPHTPAFWRTLWNRGQGLRNELSQILRSTGGQRTGTALLDIEGLRLHCIPLNDHAPHNPIVVVCRIREGCAWDEELSRLCSTWQLDEQLLRGWFEEHPRLADGKVEKALSLIEQTLRRTLELSCRQAEVNHMTTQLADTYEELNLIYRAGATMRVTRRPRGHFAQLFDDLARTTNFTTMTAVLYDTEVLDPDDRLIIGGEPIVDEAGALKIADYLESLVLPSRNALVINRLADHPRLSWAGAWLERLIVVPIVCHQETLGLVVVFNQRGNVDFNSTDVRLLNAVVDRSAVYLENVLLYGDLNKLLMGLMHALISSIDAKDPYTCGHSNRVALISQRIARKTGAAAEQADRVYLSGLLHDVGKIGISELILCKPGKLTSEEMEEMKRHPEIGGRILSGIRQLDDIIPGVLHHHEWINGSGYPAGLAGDQVPWMARVVGLADAFDAMTTGRKYRQALPLAAAMAEIRRFAGTQFCPRLVDTLIILVNEGLVEELKNVRKTPAFESVYTKWSRRVEDHR